jgi:peptidoglycan/xylan/chitin deacetylase (PgdA/CDA1 family)
MLTNGAVVISLDTELEWGFHGFDLDHHLSADGVRERKNIHRLLELFDREHAPITWAVVGHLFLDHCDGNHSALSRPSYSQTTEDWYRDDPGVNLKDAPLRYGQDIMDAIDTAKVGHEIATHTFSHVLCDRDGCSSEVLRDELRRCAELAQEKGYELTSIVFPRNGIDHLSTVADAGISIYRGRSSENVMRRTAVAGRYRKFVRFLAHCPPPVVAPVEVRDGLWNLPASQYLPYGPFSTLTTALSVSPHVGRAKRAIQRAKRQGKIFHLWAHPHNFDTGLIQDLKRILVFAREKDVPILTMRDAVAGATDGFKPS